MKIGYQGTKYCYSYQAIKRTINLEKEMIGFETFEEVFINLENDNIDFAMIPIENSTGGTIFINYDLFYSESLVSSTVSSSISELVSSVKIQSNTIFLFSLFI